jgi:hypothetical protein
VCAEDDLVAVFEEDSFFAGGKAKRFGIVFLFEKTTFGASART